MTENKNQYAVLVILALSNCAFTEDSFEDSRFIEIMRNVCQACEVSHYPNVWSFMTSLSAFCEMFVMESDGEYQFIDLSIKDILLCHYARKFITHIIKYAPCKFLSTNIKFDDAFLDETMTGVLMKKSKFHTLAERLLQDINNNSMSDVFRSTALQSKIFVDAFINHLQSKTYDEIKLLFLRCPDVRAMTSTWLHSEFKVISWAIFYGHRRILEFVLNSAIENGDSHENVIGKNKNENIRMVKLACFSGNVDMYCSIIRFFPYVEVFADSTTASSRCTFDIDVKKEIYRKNLDSFILSPNTNDDSFYASGFTVMTAACLCGNLPLVKEILHDVQKRDVCESNEHESIPSLNFVYGDNRTPLEAAILSSDCTFVKELIEIGAEVDYRIPLYSVMKSDNLEMEKTLLENGADIKKVLEQASLDGNKIVVLKILNGSCKDILKKRGQFQSCLDWALYKACEGANFHIIKLLLEQGANLNSTLPNKWTPLHIAIGKGNDKIARYLIEKGSNCNSKEDLLGRTPLHVASQKHLLQVVKLLLKRGSNCNECDVERCTPLHLAIDPHDNSIDKTADVTDDLLFLIQTLIDNKADITICDKDKISPLLSACKNQMWSVAKALIINGADFNACDENGDIPLCYASKHSALEVVEVLIERGAIVNLCNKSRKSPLHIASGNGCVLIVEKLIRNGAKVNLCDSCGKTPIHAATENGFLEVVKKLIENGSTCKTTDKFGETPLICALKYGHEDIALKLILNGADIYSSRENYNSSLIYAIKRGQWKVLEKLSTLVVASDIYQDCVKSSLCKVLVKDHENIKDPAQTPTAVLNIIEKFIEKGAHVNYCDAVGNYPLHYAVELGFQSVAEKLISHGARCNQFNLKGKSPLLIAIKERNENLSLRLIELGSTVNLFDKNEESPLICASKNDLLNVVRMLIKYGANVNQVDEFGESPLSYASKNSFLTVAEILIRNGAEIGKLNKEGESPLFQACENGHTAIVKALLYNGAKFNFASNKRNHLLLHRSLREGNLFLAEKLIDSGADCTLCDEEGKTPILIATEKGYLYIVLKLIEDEVNFIKFNDCVYQLLYAACVNGHMNVLQILIKHWFDFTYNEVQKGNLLLDTISSGHVFVACKLISLMKNFNHCNENGETALHLASLENYLCVVEKLIQNGAECNQVDKKGRSPLHLAAQNGCISIVEHLLENNSDIKIEDKYGNSPLHLASENGHALIVKSLLEHGADCNAENKHGLTPLLLAATGITGISSVVETLILHGADLNCYDDDENSPLYLAVEEGHNTVVKTLIKHGADVNSCNEDGSSPLHAVVSEYKFKQRELLILENLLANGADCNKCNENCQTPLFIAAELGNTVGVQMLINHGADVNICDNYGKSPLFVAIDEGHFSSLQILIDHGADVNLCDKDGKSPLLIATGITTIPVMQKLASHCEDCNICDINKNYFLIYTIKRGEYDINALKRTFGDGSEVNICNNYGKCPEYLAIEREDSTYMQMLIEHGADVNGCDIHGQSPLHIAVSNIKIQNVKTLLEHGADINKCDNYGISPFHIATQKNNKFVINMFFNQGAEINKTK
ncbi:serine/threonine-protein phosphatase 6 regulatory ankyrin repeat subunit C-like [Saccostrea cucullata]|uniref:serine/threonine-protein phosphatase 6 regulatory ankyrin repeat subunit C-like n=1 Tax=Saccostrea cuccullata TaxID=36930 RepID=UPI002ED07821